MAYWHKNYDGVKNKIAKQKFFDWLLYRKMGTDLFNEIAKIVGGYSVQGVISEAIGLTNQSPADVAICETYSKTRKYFYNYRS
ncbi:MAG: hypothetical protein ACP5KG_02775 [Myxococcota bacterium]